MGTFVKTKFVEHSNSKNLSIRSVEGKPSGKPCKWKFSFDQNKHVYLECNEDSTIATISSSLLTKVLKLVYCRMLIRYMQRRFSGGQRKQRKQKLNLSNWNFFQELE